MLRNEGLEQLITWALKEDVGAGDWTTLWTVPQEAMGSATIVAKEALVVSGTHPCVQVFNRVDPGLVVEVAEIDGAEVLEGASVLRIRGSLRSILTAERVALNFLGRLSGIATITRRFVKAVSGTGAQVLDTRKNTPGWRLLEKSAV
ncbi:MAG: nicotinate-nucleotide diphosphorylase, partial [Longimicrobiales bacterium]